MKESSRPGKHRSLCWNSGGSEAAKVLLLVLALLKPNFSTQLALPLLERKIGADFMEESDLNKVFKTETKRKGIPKSWSLHYVEITRQVIKKPGEEEVQTTHETGNGRETDGAPDSTREGLPLLRGHREAGEGVAATSEFVAGRGEKALPASMAFWVGRRQVDRLEEWGT